MFERIKKIVGKILRYGLPIAISVCLILWLFHKVNFKEVMAIAHRGCNYFFIGLMMVISTVALIVRGFRWGLQLRAAGVAKMPAFCEWAVLWGAYALNLVFPQMGEAWRCVFVSKRQKAPLSTVVGTDIGDRFIDWVLIMILFIWALIVAHPFIIKFMDHYAIGSKIKNVVESPTLWISVAGCLAFCAAVLYFFKDRKWVKTITLNLKRLWNGFSVVFRMKLWWLYLLLSVLTWVCYYFQTYVCLFAFDYTKTLISGQGMFYGFVPGLVMCVFGSLSMAIPSNGGLGPWNLAIMFALSLFAISDADGTAFSLVVWAFQSMTYIFLGIIAAIYIMLTGKKKPDSENPSQMKTDRIISVSIGDNLNPPAQPQPSAYIKTTSTDKNTTDKNNRAGSQ